MLAIVSLVKAKHQREMEKASFDIDVTAYPRVSPLLDGILVCGGRAAQGQKGG